MSRAMPRLTNRRLGVNIDHVATLRNARGGMHPCPVKAAHQAVNAGADSITAHLREDRRHIKDHDIERLRAELTCPLNLEIAATPDMIALAVRLKPHAVCLVPEKREERTTEGGLRLDSSDSSLKDAIQRLNEAGCRVSLFLEPDRRALETAVRLQAPVVELHTGTYAEHFATARGAMEEKCLMDAAVYGTELGLEMHAGHGLTFDNVVPLANIPALIEFNIGHFLIGEAVFSGLEAVVARMKSILLQHP
jgi:pyridoxine 5-phosphate synthase